MGRGKLPYVWLKVPGGMTLLGVFDHLLDRYHIVGTPGSGFGNMGEVFQADRFRKP